MAMMTAEVLGIDVSRVKPLVADTESVPYSDLTGGSRVTFATGKAVVEAAQDVVKQLRQRAAKIWEVDIDQVEWKDGMAVAIETDKYKPLSIADIRELVRDLKKRGIGVLITDHNVRETLDIVDRACIIYGGQVLFAGSPEALVADENVRRLYLGEGFTL